MLLLLIAGVLCADSLMLASHVALGHTIAEFSRYGDAPEFLSNAQVFGASGPHFPGYGWFLYMMNALTARAINPVILAVGVNIVCQVLSACLLYRLARIEHLEADKAILAAGLMTCFPFQSLFLTVLPLSDALKLLLVTSAFYCHKKNNAFMTILLTAALVSTRNVFVLMALGLSFYYLMERNWRPLLLSTVAYLPAVLFVLYQYLVTGNALHYINVEGPDQPLVSVPLFFLIDLVRQGPAGVASVLYQLPFLFLIFAYAFRLWRDRDIFALCYCGPLIGFLISCDVVWAYSIISRYLAFLVPFVLPMYRDFLQKRFVFSKGAFRKSFAGYVVLVSSATLLYSLINFPESNFPLFFSAMMSRLRLWLSPGW
ncbi:MAG: hypothetical protein ACM3ON_02510 [Chloroflexota bacterium]